MLVLQRVTVLTGLALLAFACGERFTALEPAAGGAAGSGHGAAAGVPGGGDGGVDAGGIDAGGVDSEGGVPSGGTVSGGRGGLGSVGGVGASAGKANNSGGGGKGGEGGSTIIGEPPIPLVGLELWFDANVGVTQTNGAVSVWKDRSAQQRDARQTALNYRPKLDPAKLNGKPAIVFDGADDYLRLPTLTTNFSQGVTIFAVGQQLTDPGKCGAIFEASNGPEVDDLHLGFWQSAVIYEVDVDYIHAADHPLVLGDAQLLAAVHRTSQDAQLRRNSNALGEGNFRLPKVIDRAQVFIGHSEYLDCAPYTGSVAELIVYSRAVSDTELVDIESYLQTKWGCCAE